MSINKELIISKRKHIGLALILTIGITFGNFHSYVGIHEGDRLTYRLDSYTDNINNSSNYLLGGEVPINPGETFELKVDDINSEKTSVEYQVTVEEDLRGNFTQSIGKWDNYALKTKPSEIQKGDFDFLGVIPVFPLISGPVVRINFSDPVGEIDETVVRKTSYSIWDEKNSRYIYYNYTYIANTRKGIIDTLDFSIIAVSELTDTSVILYSLSISNNDYTSFRIPFPFILIFSVMLFSIGMAEKAYTEFLSRRGFDNFGQYREARRYGCKTKDLYDQLDKTGARNCDELHEIKELGFSTRKEYEQSKKGGKKKNKRLNSNGISNF